MPLKKGDRVLCKEEEGDDWEENAILSHVGEAVYTMLSCQNEVNVVDLTAEPGRAPRPTEAASHDEGDSSFGN